MSKCKHTTPNELGCCMRCGKKLKITESPIDEKEDSVS